MFFRHTEAHHVSLQVVTAAPASPAFSKHRAVLLDVTAVHSLSRSARGGRRPLLQQQEEDLAVAAAACS